MVVPFDQNTDSAVPGFMAVGGYDDRMPTSLQNPRMGFFVISYIAFVRATGIVLRFLGQVRTFPAQSADLIRLTDASGFSGVFGGGQDRGE